MAITITSVFKTLDLQFRVSVVIIKRKSVCIKKKSSLLDRRVEKGVNFTCAVLFSVFDILSERIYFRGSRRIRKKLNPPQNFHATQ